MERCSSSNGQVVPQLMDGHTNSGSSSPDIPGQESPVRENNKKAAEVRVSWTEGHI
jgi:hypothetical protein